MKSRPCAPQRPTGRAESEADEVELSVIALLCLLFAWPPEESTNALPGPPSP
jgi:hypothetical protein